MSGHSACADTRTVLQIEETECGAACLSMILQYYGQVVSLEQLRLETDVSRDGCSAGNIARAAQRRGLQCDGFRKDAAELGELQPPCILWWDHNHFVVYEGMRRGICYINDPAWGKRQIHPQKLEEHFSGIVLTFSPTQKFKSFPEFGRKPKSYLRSGRISGFLRSYRGKSAAAIIAGVCSVMAGLTAAWLLMSAGSFPVAGGIRLWICLSAACLVCFLGGRIIQEQLLRQLEDRNEMEMSWRFLRRLFRMPLAFVEQRSAGDLGERIRRNDRISRFTANTWLRVIIDTAGICLGVLFAGCHAPIAAFEIVLALVLVFAIRKRYARAILHDRTRASISDADLARTVLAGTDKIETIRNLNLGRSYADKAACQQQESMQIHQKLEKAVIMETVLRYAVYGLCVIGLLLAMRDSMPPEVPSGQLRFALALLILLLLLIPSAETLVKAAAEIPRLDDELGSVDDIAGRETEAPEETETAIRYQRLEGNIRCHQVAFSYGAFGENVVEDLNLYLPVGSVLSVTGSSGSGKSTVGKLLGRLLTPQEGVILFDGRPAGEIPEQVISSCIAMVEQKPQLFAGSIRSNITMWNPNVTEDDLWEAIADACVEDCVRSRAEGLETLLGERGEGLSGGEQQRLEIARALATNPSILILDEAFSAIDDDTASRIMANIRRRGCTCVLITNDPLLADDGSQKLQLDESGGEM